MACRPDSPGDASPSAQKQGTTMHQRSLKTLVAGGVALAVGVTLTAFGAPPMRPTSRGSPPRLAPTTRS